MWVKKIINYPLGNDETTTYKMVMTGGWFIIVLTTFMDDFGAPKISGLAVISCGEIIYKWCLR